MNLKDINDYLVENPRADTFWRDVKKEEPIYVDAMKLAGKDCKDTVGVYKRIEEFVMGDGRHFSFEGYCTNNAIITNLHIRASCDGFYIKFCFKGVTYRGYTLQDGTIEKVHYYILNNDFTGYHIANLDELVEETKQNATRVKRERMAYYNKLIKETKQEYRDALTELNAILKEKYSYERN